MWLTRPSFIRWQVDREGKDQAAAELEWERQMQVLPDSRQDRANNRLLIYVEDFAIALNFKDQAERLDYGHKDAKYPTDATLSQKLAWMWQDHASCCDMGKDFGLHGALDKQAHMFGISSKPTDPGQLAALQEQEEDLKNTKASAE